MSAARRLEPAEVSTLCSLLRGRVSWRGEYALADELGIDVRDLRRAIRRAHLSPRTLLRLRLALAVIGLDATPVLLAGGRAAA